MKKHFIILFFTLIIISAYTAETWLSAEYQYGVSFFKGENLSYESHPDKKAFRVSSNGVNIKTYTFWNNQNIGLFTKIDFYLPYFDNSYNQNDHIRNIGFPLSFGSGVGFRYILSEKSIIHYAVGLNLNFNLLFAKVKKLDFPKSNTKIYAHEFIFGLISDIGYKYNINNNVYLNAGANLNFGFAKHIKQSSKSDLNNNITSKWAKGFFSFEFLPYFGIGFIINSK